MFRTLAALFVLVFMTLGMAPAMAQQGAGEADSGVDSAADAPDNPVVAVVDGFEIRQSDVAIAFQRLPEQFRQAPVGQVFTQLVQQLVDGELIVKAGREVDLENDPDVVSLVGASAALTISGIPFLGPIGGARVGYKDGEFMLNPTTEQLEGTELDMMVAGTKDAVLNRNPAK